MYRPILVEQRNVGEWDSSLAYRLRNKEFTLRVLCGPVRDVSSSLGKHQTISIRTVLEVPTCLSMSYSLGGPTSGRSALAVNDPVFRTRCCRARASTSLSAKVRIWLKLSSERCSSYVTTWGCFVRWSSHYVGIRSLDMRPYLGRVVLGVRF